MQNGRIFKQYEVNNDVKNIPFNGSQDFGKIFCSFAVVVLILFRRAPVLLEFDIYNYLRRKTCRI